MQQQHGSGKTAVLVERIINKIINENVDIDKLLVVTFTNAAASEMRQRVLEAIYKRLEKEPDNKNLQRQIVLLAKSNICTIHSFCLDVIKNNFYEIDIAPNFKIGEQAELEILKQEVLEEIFEEKYENQDESFLKLINLYTGYRQDDSLKEIILDIYNYIQSMPFPKKWLDEKIEMFNRNKSQDFSETIWGVTLINNIKQEIAFNLNRLKAIQKQLHKFEELEKFENIIKLDIYSLEEYLKLNSWDEMYNKILEMNFERWPSDKKITNLLKDEAKDKRNKVKDEIKKLKDKILLYDSAQALGDLQEMHQILYFLKSIIYEFMDKYAKEKKEKNVIDFNDIEHFALNILVKEDEDGKIIPTHVAKKYQNKFAEIAIDEYQDSNLVQEYILSTISNLKNMFMVGDVKQSIYKFRQACPELFLEKYEKYKLKENKSENDNLKIQLFKNFRSRENVLDITNKIFQDIMSKSLGDIEYDTKEYLNLGASYPEPINDMKTQVEIIDLKEEISDNQEEEETEEIIENISLEAKWVAQKIKNLISSHMMVWDNKKQEYRTITYKDIVVLLRSTSITAPIYEKEIQNLNIPVFSDISGSYLDSIEIQVILSLLKIIDNPMQDIPLVTVLRSMIGGFNDNELIEIRMCNKNVTFYESMQEYLNLKEAKMQIQQKIEKFFKQIDSWRKKQEYKGLDELIWQVYIESGYYNYVSLMPNGNQRIANLKLLFEKAKQYEKSSFKGLFNFIHFIEKLNKTSGDFGSAKLIGENDNVVRIMSIHKSKGLEFPVVFLCQTGKQFNMRDLNGEILLHPELGIGPQYISEERRIQYNTLAKESIKQIAKNETISEEMRILYVALTRAKEKIIITGVAKDLQKELADKRELLEYNDKEDKIKPYIIKKAKSYLDWIEMVYLNNNSNEETFNFKVYSKQEVLKEIKDKTQKEKIDILKLLENKGDKNKLDKEILERITWKYPHSSSFEIPTKSSVTKIKQMAQGKIEDIEYERINMNVPKFMEEETSIDGAKKGTLIHMCLQRLDYSRDYEKNDIMQMINNMKENEVITQKEADAININKVYSFVKSNIWKDLKKAKKVYREQPFYINIPAKEIYNEDVDEKILVQGIIDLYYINSNGEVILVDYKTDYVENKDEKQLVEKYKKQLEIYQRALEGALNKKVDKKYIYSTFLEKEIIV